MPGPWTRWRSDRGLGLVLGFAIGLEVMACAPASASVHPSEGEFAAAIDPSPGELATRVAQSFIDRHPPDRLAWRWETAIVTYALARMAQQQPEAGWSPYLIEHYRAHPSPRIRRPDDCAPALGAAVLVSMGIEDPAVVRALDPVARYLRDTPRNELGALDHLDPDSPLGHLYPPSIWVDSLVMVGLTAALLGQAQGDEALMAFAHAQPAIYAAHLQDPVTGLFLHAYLHQRDRTRPEEDVFWLRGNGWVALALVELLATMEPDQPEFLSTRVIVRRLAAGLWAHRSPAGTWTTVVDLPRTYEETSGTALVAYALAKGARLGLLPREYRTMAPQTLQTLADRLRVRRGQPVVTQTSGPTIPGSLPTRGGGYALVSRRTDVPYGVGAFLLLSTELGVEAALETPYVPSTRQPAAP